MGRLTQDLTERELWRNYYVEAMDLIGQDCQIKFVTKEKDMYNDYDIEVTMTVEAGLLYEENPKPLIESFGWHLEDDELPFVAYLAIKDREYQEMEIQKGIYIVVEGKEFEVTRVRADYVSNLVWIVTMVPRRFREKDVPKANTGYSYLKR